MFSKKKLSLGAMLFAVAAIAVAGYVQATFTAINTAGTTVLSTGPVVVETLHVASVAGSDAHVLNFYNATSATGAVAANLVYPVAIPTAGTGSDYTLNAKFSKGLVISTAGSPETVTGAVSFYSIPSNY